MVKLTKKTETMIKEIETIVSSVETISFDFADRLLKQIDQLDKETLQIVVDRRIKFMWHPAKLRLDEMKGA